MNNEERLVDIEIKLSHQEDLVESLNQLVYEQQTRIDLLDKEPVMPLGIVTTQPDRSPMFAITPR